MEELKLTKKEFKAVTESFFERLEVDMVNQSFRDFESR